MNEVKINQRMYGVSKDYKNKWIRPYKVVDSSNIHMKNNSYKLIGDYPKGTYIAKPNKANTYLNAYDMVFFDNRDDAVTYHNILVEEHIQAERDRYSIVYRH